VYKRQVQDVLNHTVTELGELTMEVIINQGKSYKQPGKDGIIGEAIDMIACAVDIIRLHSPELTEEDIIGIALPKLAKWKDKAMEVQNRHTQDALDNHEKRN
jgi:hypothetical protein